MLYFKSERKYMVEKIGRQVINDLFLFSSKNRSCCNANDKYKVMNNSNQDVISEHTKVRRNVDIILYSLGGRTQYGFIQPQQLRRITFLGRTEGQPGGILGPIKNKF
jgi:hypothetical protein